MESQKQFFTQQESGGKRIFQMRKETQRHSDRNEEAVIVHISQSCSRCAKHPDTDFTVRFTEDKLQNTGI